MSAGNRGACTAEKEPDRRYKVTRDGETSSDGLGLLSYLFRPHSQVWCSWLRGKNLWKEWNFRNFVQVQNKSSHRTPKQKTINKYVQINTYRKTNFPYIYIYVNMCVCVCVCTEENKTKSKFKKMFFFQNFMYTFLKWHHKQFSHAIFFMESFFMTADIFNGYTINTFILIWVS